MRAMFLAATLVLLCSGCSPEVGSAKWCALMKEKPKSEWTLKETKEYAGHCVFR